MCEEEGREVGKFLYLGQVAWPSVPTESRTRILFLNIVGKMTAFLFLALLVDCLQHVRRSAPFKMCLSACARTIAGRGAGPSLIGAGPTDDGRRVGGRSHSDVGANDGTPPLTTPPTGPRQGDRRGGGAGAEGGGGSHGSRMWHGSSPPSPRRPKDAGKRWLQRGELSSD